MTPLIKQRRCKLEQPISGDQQQTAISRLQSVAGVQQASIDSNVLLISYEAGVCHYAALRTLIAGLLPLKKETVFSKLVNDLIEFMENNEYQHRTTATGSEQAIKSLYLSMHDKRQGY